MTNMVSPACRSEAAGRPSAIYFLNNFPCFEFSLPVRQAGIFNF
jgi:hypothetical protein